MPKTNNNRSSSSAAAALLSLDQIKGLLWRRGELRWKLDPHQQEIYDLVKANDAREILFLCSRQWGKSFLNVILALECCIRNPGCRVLIASDTQTQALTIVNNNLSKIIQDAPRGLIKRHKSEKKWTIGTSELCIGILASAHVDTLRGTSALLIILEEGSFVKSEDYSEAIGVVAPQLIRANGTLIHVTTPSDEPEHHIHTDIIPKTELTDSLYKRDIYTNTALSEKDRQAAQALVTPEQWRREYLVEIVRDPTKVCVPEFDVNTHVWQEPRPEPQHANYCTTIDFGGVQDFTAALLAYYDFANATILVRDERFFRNNTDTKTIIDAVKEMESSYNVTQRICDAGGQNRVDMRALHDYSLTFPQKADWEANLNFLRLQMSQGKIKIHPDCKMLIATLKSATFNKQRTDFARNSHLGHMDMLAALMYLNRCIDRHTNPMPQQTLGHDQWQRPDAMTRRHKLNELGRAIQPRRFT